MMYKSSLSNRQKMDTHTHHTNIFKMKKWNLEEIEALNIYEYQLGQESCWRANDKISSTDYFLLWFAFAFDSQRFTVSWEHVKCQTYVLSIPAPLR